MNIGEYSVRSKVVSWLLVVIMVGGEHSISSPPILAHVDRMAAELSVLQLDAHTDLRSEYEGTPYSHACVMHRVHRRAKVVPVGIRSLTTEERAREVRKAIQYDPEPPV